MAKSGGRLATTARLFVAAMLVAGAVPVAPGSAQRVELRTGVVVSSALVSDAIAQGASTVRETARPGPLLGAAFLAPLRHGLSLEAGGAYTFSALRGQDASGSWGSQSLGVAQALVGVRYRLAVGSTGPAAFAGPYLRGAVGGVRYVTASRSIFDAGNAIEPAVELAAGWGRVVSSWAAGGELGAQLHAFAPERLRQAGGSAGGVKRVFLLLTLSRSVAR